MKKILVMLTAILMLSFSALARAGGTDVSVVEEDMLSVISAVPQNSVEVVLSDMQSQNDYQFIVERPLSLNIGNLRLTNTITNYKAKGGVQEFYLIESNDLLKVPWNYSTEDHLYKSYAKLDSPIKEKSPEPNWFNNKDSFRYCTPVDYNKLE